MTLADLYPAHLETVRKRYDDAMSRLGYDQVVIYAGSHHMIFLDDMPYPFKVNPLFKAWVPIVDNPHCFLVYRPGTKPAIIFWQPVDYWYKPAETPRDFWVEHFDLKFIPEPEDARKHLPSNAKRSALLGEIDASISAWGLGEINPQALLDDIHYRRAWKTPYEVECVRMATTSGVRAHIAARDAYFDGKSEFEIHIEYMRIAQHAEAQLPYGNIVACNEHASVLHYQHQDRDPLANDRRYAFLLDAGTTVNGYACDITRTYSDQREFADMIDAMDRAQQELCAMIRPGLDYKDVHMAAHRKVGGILSNMGFVDIPGDDAFAKGITSTFFPHGVGHYLGLQVHDVGGFSADEHGTTIPKPEGHPYLRLTRVVEPGMVFTIEPGIYFIDSLLDDLKKNANAKHVNWDKVDSFRKFGGVRIEDDIVVTKDGFENMTRNEWARQEA